MPTERIVPQSEVIRAIVSEDGPFCGGPRTGRVQMGRPWRDLPPEETGSAEGGVLTTKAVGAHKAKGDVLAAEAAETRGKNAVSWSRWQWEHEAKAVSWPRRQQKHEAKGGVLATKAVGTQGKCGVLHVIVVHTISKNISHTAKDVVCLAWEFKMLLLELPGLLASSFVGHRKLTFGTDAIFFRC